jgi:hypothetical protein
MRRDERYRLMSGKSKLGLALTRNALPSTVAVGPASRSTNPRKPRSVAYTAYRAGQASFPFLGNKASTATANRAPSKVPRAAAARSSAADAASGGRATAADMAISIAKGIGPAAR